MGKAALKEYEKLPERAREIFDADINAIQKNQRPFSDVKNLEGVGPGVMELIINGSPAYRCIYCVKIKGCVVVLHSFVKTAEGTDRKAMATTKRRYKEMLREFK